MSAERESMTWDEARTAILYEKPQLVAARDYAWRTTEARITFPWSAEPPVTESAPASEQQRRYGVLTSSSAERTSA